MSDSNTAYDLLFAAIRTRCQQDHWYGPELSSPKSRKGVSLDNPRRLGFAYLPASEELLVRTEAALGFALPPLLHALYAKVANGGFGPGAGLQGALEGYGRPGDSIYANSDDTIVAHYLWRSAERTVPLASFEGQWSQYDNVLVPAGKWPEKLLPLCDLGCVQHACISSDEQMYIVAPSQDDAAYVLVNLAISFEMWLWGWVRDEYKIVYYGSHAQKV